MHKLAQGEGHEEEDPPPSAGVFQELLQSLLAEIVVKARRGGHDIEGDEEPGDD